MNYINGIRNKTTVEASALKKHIGESVKIHGSIYKIRKMKDFAFVLLRTSDRVIQCIYSKEKAQFELEALIEESCVIFTADVIEEERGL